MSSERAAVSDSELTVLQVFWEKGPLKVSQVREVLRNLGNRWAYNTVQTLIRRLEKKGYLKGNKDGKAHLYTTLLSKQDFLSESLDEICDRVCAGSKTPMVHALIEGHIFSKKEIQEFRDLLMQLEDEAEGPDEGGGNDLLAP